MQVPVWLKIILIDIAFYHKAPRQAQEDKRSIHTTRIFKKTCHAELSNHVIIFNVILLCGKILRQAQEDNFLRGTDDSTVDEDDMIQTITYYYASRKAQEDKRCILCNTNFKKYVMLSLVEASQYF
ncbi:MAG: hypothetical protein ACOH2A_15475 [Sphingobacteriaceae bacterium]